VLPCAWLLCCFIIRPTFTTAGWAAAVRSGCVTLAINAAVIYWSCPAASVLSALLLLLLLLLLLY
jgi:hypothetical protein